MAAPAWRCVHLLISGRVQGVWYRGWTLEQARALNLDGWVRNRLDGAVEAVVSGPEDAVANLIEACREGPRAARVDAIEISEDADAPEPGFQQRPTVCPTV